MDPIDTILDRLGGRGPEGPDAEKLRRLHRAFSFAVPYENIGVQLEEPLEAGIDRTLARVVAEVGGGWCYDLNEVFARILERAGFAVRRALGAGNRETYGDEWNGSHLVLLVDLPEGRWLADVGYGDGPLDPVPLAAHAFRSNFFRCRLSALGGGWWRYHNDPRASAPSFDFHDSDPGRDSLARMRLWLAADAESPYVQTLVAQRWRPDAHVTLRGKVLTTIRPDGRERRLLDAKGDWVQALAEGFAIVLEPEQADTLWDKVSARHAGRL